jgi:hypothetical protein
MVRCLASLSSTAHAIVVPVNAIQILILKSASSDKAPDTRMVVVCPDSVAIASLAHQKAAIHPQVRMKVRIVLYFSSFS